MNLHVVKNAETYFVGMKKVFVKGWKNLLARIKGVFLSRTRSFTDLYVFQN
jgi:hypothetical protein